MLSVTLPFVPRPSPNNNTESDFVRSAFWKAVFLKLHHATDDTLCLLDASLFPAVGISIGNDIANSFAEFAILASSSMQFLHPIQYSFGSLSTSCFSTFSPSIERSGKGNGIGSNILKDSIVVERLHAHQNPFCVFGTILILAI